jgi:hypothetical protein
MMLMISGSCHSVLLWCSELVPSYEDKLSALGCHIAGTGASVWDKLPPLPSCKCLFLGPQRDQVYSLENETEESWDDDFSQASIQGFLRNGTTTKMSKSSVSVVVS